MTAELLASLRSNTKGFPFHLEGWKNHYSFKDVTFKLLTVDITMSLKDLEGESFLTFSAKVRAHLEEMYGPQVRLTFKFSVQHKGEPIIEGAKFDLEGIDPNNLPTEKDLEVLEAEILEEIDEEVRFAIEEAL